MDLNQSMKILNITKNDLYSLNKDKLKKIFQIKALKMHPDKGGNSNDFINLKLARDNIQIVLEERKNINNEGIDGVDSYMNLELLKSYCSIFMDSVKKYHTTNNKKITLTPSINDILSNNVRQLNYDSNIYFVPLWHDEVIFDSKDKDLIVTCKPILPDNMYIDLNRNIHIKLNIKYTSLIGEKIYHFNIADTSKYEINIESLYIKDYQVYILKNKGISKINMNNIYDIENKHDIFAHIYLH